MAQDQQNAPTAEDAQAPVAGPGEPRTVAERADRVGLQQDRLAADINELADRINPKNVALRTKNELVTKARELVTTEDGGVNVPVVAGLGAGVSALGTGVVLLARKRANDAERIAAEEIGRRFLATRDHAQERADDAHKAIRKARKAAKRGGRPFEAELQFERAARDLQRDAEIAARDAQRAAEGFHLNQRV